MVLNEFFGKEVFRSAYADRELPQLSYGVKFDEACAKHTKRLDVSRIYVLISRSLTTKTDTLQRLKIALQDRIIGIRIGIGAHTPIAECVEVINEVRDLGGIDCIITVGGGSVTDAGKLVAFAVANEAYDAKEIDTLWGGKSHNPNLRTTIQVSSIPLICIPTSLSGGEYQHIAGATESETHAKRTFEPMVDPTMVILDPDLCLATPQWLWLSSGIRAVDHCIETLCSLQSNSKGDVEAEKGLQKLIPGLLRCKEDATDLEARHSCQLGVVSAMAAVSSGVPLGASHAIGHQLGPLGVGHGETSCILLPAVCKFNAAHGANNDRQERCKQILLRDKTVVATLNDRDLEVLDLGDILATVVEKLGLPRSLKDVHVGRDKLERLANNSLHDIWIKTNAVPIEHASQVLEILEMVVGD